MMESDEDLIGDLLYATVSRDVHKVDELMQYGIDPCTPTRDGTSPIHKAALIESPSGSRIVSKMLSYGADPNVVTPTGLSPLHIAAMWGRVDTIDVLLDSGADVSLKDQDDMSALDYTAEAEEHREECIDALTRYRPPVKRKPCCFLSKSRYHIDRILGGDDVCFSTTMETSNNSINICQSSEKIPICPHDESLTENVVLCIDDVDAPRVPRKEVEIECSSLEEKTLQQNCSDVLEDDSDSKSPDCCCEKTLHEGSHENVLVRTLRKNKYLKKDRQKKCSSQGSCKVCKRKLNCNAEMVTDVNNNNGHFSSNNINNDSTNNRYNDKNKNRSRKKWNKNDKSEDIKNKENENKTIQVSNKSKAKGKGQLRDISNFSNVSENVVIDVCGPPSGAPTPYEAAGVIKESDAPFSSSSEDDLYDSSDHLEISSAHLQTTSVATNTNINDIQCKTPTVVTTTPSAVATMKSVAVQTVSSVAVQTEFEDLEKPLQCTRSVDNTNTISNNTTLFHSCLDQTDDSVLFEVSGGISHIVSSTMIEDASLNDDVNGGGVRGSGGGDHVGGESGNGAGGRNKVTSRKAIDYDMLKKKYADPPRGYYGDISDATTDSVSETSLNDCFWSPPITPGQTSCSRTSSLRRKSNVFRYPTTPTQATTTATSAKQGNPSCCTPSPISSPKRRASRAKDYIAKCYDTTPKHSPRRSSSLFVPMSPSGMKKSPSCEVLLKISVVNPYDTDDERLQQQQQNAVQQQDLESIGVTAIPCNGDLKDHAGEVEKGDIGALYEENLVEDVVTIGDCIDAALPAPTDIAISNTSAELEELPDDQLLVDNMTNMSLHHNEADETCQTYINLDNNHNNTVSLDCEATVDYASAKIPTSSDHLPDPTLYNPHLPDPNFPHVPELVQYYEEKSEESLVEQNNSMLATKVNTTYDTSCKLTSVTPRQVARQEGVIEELCAVGVEYDWKDVSDVSCLKSDVSCVGHVQSEVEESFVVVPGSIMSLTDEELRQRLIKVGETPGPISATTRKVYQKYLTKLEKNNYRPFKPNEKYKDYTPEVRLLLNGVTPLSRIIEDGDLLESEMALKFVHPEKHTWREGSMKTSFNYLLLDPRVTNNLPDRGKNMTTMEKLRVFLAAVFYVGKGKKSRPYEHLYEAIKVEKDETGTRPLTVKLKMISDIWLDGHGVVSLHIFHSVIPVEAFTREACMIEAMGLPRLTNAKAGDFYGDAASWSGKKRRQLGMYILYKAMEIYMLEGERQIRQIDLVKHT